jgi:transcriptional regulator EpsA
MTTQPSASIDNTLPQPASAAPSRSLSLSHAEAIVSTVEAASQVLLRSQFFVWTQSQMQALLPHRVLACGAYDRTRRRVLFNVFNSIWLPPDALIALGDESSPFLSAIVSAWLGGGNQPLVIDLRLVTAEAAPIAALLREQADVQRLLAHGITRPRRPHEIESFFLFADSGSSETGRLKSSIELMLPFLHVAWRRVVCTDAAAGPADPAALVALRRDAARSNMLVTGRECQILEGVRDGKSNREIAEALGLSPLTVKNHVQKILRKLGASNRTQAVTHAMASGLLASAHQSGASGASSG